MDFRQEIFQREWILFAEEGGTMKIIILLYVILEWFAIRIPIIITMDTLNNNQIFLMLEHGHQMIIYVLPEWFANSISILTMDISNSNQTFP